MPEGGFLSAIGCCLVFVAATNGVYRLLEHLIINHIYGQAAWEQGLRVIDKHGNLSNGDSLIWSNILLALGTFILSILLAFCRATSLDCVLLKDSKVIRDVLNAIFVPSIQLFYACTSEPE